MLIQLLWIVVGLVVVLFGADRLTVGAVAIARRLHISQLVIGLTIVAMGTSMPEFCVSLVSALKGTPDIAVGNVVGSNIFNTLFIVGLAAAVTPITILKTTVRRDIPFALFASVLLLLLCLNGNISRTDAGLLLIVFVLFMALTFHDAKPDGEEDTSSAAPPASVLKSVFFLLLGLAALIFGSNLFVEAATQVASRLGVSDAVIGLTIVAGGTSLPELATSIVAARKGNSGIAIGNVLGSNVFNILAILGLTGLIAPMEIQGITSSDFAVLILSMFLLWLFSYTKYKINRLEGVALAGFFVAYIAYLLMNL